MTDAHGGSSVALYGVPLGLWIAVLLALLSAGFAVIVAWRSNANSRRNLDEQLARGSQQVLKQLKHQAEQQAEQRAHDAAQLARQLAHDSEQRDRDRQHALRREVHLEAATALTNLLSLVGRAANLEEDETAIVEKFGHNQAVLSKVHIVGAEATVDAVMTYMNELVPAFIELITRRVPLRMRQRAIDTRVELMRKADGERTHCETMMRQLRLDGLKDSPRWLSVEAQYKLASQQFAVEQRTAQKLREVQIEEQLQTGQRSVNLLAQSARLLPGAMAAVRGEVEAPLDRRRYEQLWNVQVGKVEVLYKQAMDRIRSTSAQAGPARFGDRAADDSR
jgi:hypothetical protein